MVQGSWLMATNGSGLRIKGSRQLMVQGSWLMVQGSWSYTVHD